MAGKNTLKTNENSINNGNDTQRRNEQSLNFSTADQVVAESLQTKSPTKKTAKKVTKKRTKTPAQIKKENLETTAEVVVAATPGSSSSAAKNLYHRREAVCDRCRKWKRACYGVNAACNNCLMANHACTVSTPMIRKCKPKPVKILGLPITQSTNIPSKSHQKDSVSTSNMSSPVNTMAAHACEPAGSLRKEPLSQLAFKMPVEEHPQYKKLLAENTALLNNEKKLIMDKSQVTKNLAQANQTITSLLEQMAVQTKKLEEANNTLLLTLQRQTQESLSAASEHLISIPTVHPKVAKNSYKYDSTSSSTVVGTPDNQNHTDSTSLDALFSTKAQPSTIFRGESFENLSQAKEMINLREEELIGDLGFPSKMSTIKNSIFLNDMDKDFLKTLGVDI